MKLERPSVSVIVPFNGPAAARDELLDRFSKLDLRAEDCVLIVDNRREACDEPPREDADQPTSAARIVRAASQQSSYFARNRGAERATGEWLLFMDADVYPTPGILDSYFDPQPAERTGLLVGGVIDEEPVNSSGWAARYAFLKQVVGHENTLRRPRPFAKTANCAVRRAAFEAVGGFVEGIRSAGDADLCFRIVDAGWNMEIREHAAVHHRGRRTLIGLLGQRTRQGSGMGWLNSRYPGVAERRSLLVLSRQAAYGIVVGLVSLARGRRDQAIVQVLHPVVILCSEIGRYVPNRPWAEMLPFRLGHRRQSR